MTYYIQLGSRQRRRLRVYDELELLLRDKICIIKTQ